MHIHQGLLELDAVEAIMGHVLFRRMSQKTEHLMDSSDSVHRVSSNDSNLKIVIQDTVRQVGILTSSLGCFMVNFEKEPGSRWAHIKGREVDMIELRRCLTEYFDKSEIIRALGSPILS